MNTEQVRRHIADSEICCQLLDRGVSCLKAENLRRYRDLLEALRSKVYSDKLTTSGNVQMYDSISPVTGQTEDASASLQMFGMNGEGIETYLSQVSDFMDVGLFDVDESLNAWYHALVEEVQHQ